MGTVLEGEWSLDPVTENHFQGLQVSPRKNSELAKEGRMKYMHYFNGKGSVPWQDSMVQNKAKK